ncbi:hypothetical protein [Persicitalea jodogahamensis]|uniref:Lipoprotein n=1 Tax=Persicitalea jodogahamensis TaxID=402147 RepID=A0A8J3D7W3_9BACT|nr:hypothetical protein [Persicitalea jodogahamensis]GHB86161.1 hypothetical protein GCM10007390_47020 [Persicitalea jodogahamensis]
MDKKISALAVLILSATIGCQHRVLKGKRYKNYELLQYRSVLEAMDNTNQLESQRLEYLIPPTFSYAEIEAFGDFSDEATPDSLEKPIGGEGAVLIPSQFSVLKIISAQEQQRALEEEADEKLYRSQSDPAYYENAKRAFQAEYKRRMGAKGLK